MYSPRGATTIANGNVPVWKGPVVRGNSTAPAWMSYAISWFCTLSVAYTNLEVGSMAMPVGVEPARNGLPAAAVRVPFDATGKPEIVPCAGQDAGVAGVLVVLGGAVVTM